MGTGSTSENWLRKSQISRICGARSAGTTGVPCTKEDAPYSPLPPFSAVAEREAVTVAAATAAAVGGTLALKSTPSPLLLPPLLFLLPLLLLWSCRRCSALASSLSMLVVPFCCARSPCLRCCCRCSAFSASDSHFF